MLLTSRSRSGVLDDRVGSRGERQDVISVGSKGCKSFDERLVIPKLRV